MYKFIWHIRKVSKGLYSIELDRDSFGFDQFPKEDICWQNDNIPELMHEAREVVRNFALADPYQKIWEYAEFIYGVNEEVIEEVQGEKHSLTIGCLGCIWYIAIPIIAFILGALFG